MVLAALGTLLSGRRLRPELIESCEADWANVVVGHTVSVRHTPRSDIGGKSGRYTLVIDGTRWHEATWHFWPGELESLIRAAGA